MTTQGGKLSHTGPWCGFGGLAAGVAVHLRVEHHDVDVLVRRAHMVQPPVADVVGPTIAANGPLHLPRQHVAIRAQRLQHAQVAVVSIFERLDHLLRRLHGLCHVLPNALPGRQRLLQRGRHVRIVGHHAICECIKSFPPDLRSLRHAEGKLGIVLEERVRPGRAPARAIGGVRVVGVAPGPDGRAACGVGYEGLLAEQPRDESHDGCLTTA
mmetsp:Transcript_6936/g.20460  ORF Transcript_6936/g.20460 Transcript_6936/m.20460 type:complete len:212 (-) Transcript_6936:1278-1913(-)